MSELMELDSLYITTVLEDTVDQLAVLGKIMPQTYEGRADANEVCTRKLTATTGVNFVPILF